MTGRQTYIMRNERPYMSVLLQDPYDDGAFCAHGDNVNVVWNMAAWYSRGSGPLVKVPTARVELCYPPPSPDMEPKQTAPHISPLPGGRKFSVVPKTRSHCVCPSICRTRQCANIQWVDAQLLGYSVELWNTSSHRLMSIIYTISSSLSWTPIMWAYSNTATV